MNGAVVSHDGATLMFQWLPLSLSLLFCLNETESLVAQASLQLLILLLFPRVEITGMRHQVSGFSFSKGLRALGWGELSGRSLAGMHEPLKGEAGDSQIWTRLLTNSKSPSSAPPPRLSSQSTNGKTWTSSPDS